MIGYCVSIMPELASFRLRVAIPAAHMGLDYQIGCTGAPSFFYKNGNAGLAKVLRSGVVYDVVNDHFKGKQAADYFAMCDAADVITCASERMASIIQYATGRAATVIADPWENNEQMPTVSGQLVLWFGHQANINSLRSYSDIDMQLCTGQPWSLANERSALDAAAVVLLTGSNPGASANRVVKALRAGRAVVVPADCPDSWRDLADYIWIGEVREGIAWTLNNREEACSKILAGQKYIRTRYSPQLIGSQWAALFGLISGQDTSKSPVGCVSTLQ